MGTIKIDQIRIANFRGLKDFKMSLEDTTILTGMNNVGKTSVLKAMQIALGSSSFLTPQDFHIDNSIKASKIVVDIRIIAVDDDGVRQKEFTPEWEAQLKANSVKVDSGDFSYVPFRTIVEYNEVSKEYKKSHIILSEWEVTGQNWQDISGTKPQTTNFGIQFSYIDAHRDIMEDIRSRSSFVGKLLSDIPNSINPEDLRELENNISALNDKAVNNSNILKELQDTLKGVETTMDETGAAVKITPFTQKVRDLYKSVSIEYGKPDKSLTMDYHGMGTRSWSSMLSFEAFLNIQQKAAEQNNELVYPVIAIEEPETHLHPNAQKQLYEQMNSMPGQKLISTHSPSVVSQAKLEQIRGLYKTDTGVACGMLQITNPEMRRKIKQKVINTKGEIFFSKAIVLFEGETEEQALPAFAKRYLSEVKTLNIDFVGVGGAGQYDHFLNFAKSFNIPWFIFSDGDEKGVKETKKSVCKILEVDDIDINNQPNVVVISDGRDFETMLLAEGYQDEAEKALNAIKPDIIERYIRTGGKAAKPKKTQEICPTCNQNIYKKEDKSYAGAEGRTLAIRELMADNKTAFAALIADFIEESGKPIPPTVARLLDKVNAEIYG